MSALCPACGRKPGPSHDAYTQCPINAAKGAKAAQRNPVPAAGVRPDTSVDTLARTGRAAAVLEAERVSVDQFDLAMPKDDYIDPLIGRVGDTVVVGYVTHDDDPQNPRDWDNAGTMATWHRRYELGDEQPKVTPQEQRFALACEHDADLAEWSERLYEGDNWTDVPGDTDDAKHEKAEAMIQERVDRVMADHYVELPLYLHDHSGLAMNTGGFGDPWDSGQVGVIYAERGTDGLNDEQLADRLKAEVDTYDKYLRNEAYGVVVETFDAHTSEPVGEPLYSFGYLGDDDAKEGLASEFGSAVRLLTANR